MERVNLEHLDYLQEKRLDLINEYYYWISRMSDEEEFDDVLEDLKNEIKTIEKTIEALRGDY
jgi:hypothetical protein